MSRRGIGIVALGLAAATGCSDLGTEPDPVSDMAPDGSDVTVTEVVPVRTVIGDEVVLRGSGFGAEPADRVVEFETALGVAAASVISWASDAVVVEVPADAVTGDVVVRDGDAISDPISFDVAPRVVSFATDVAPLFVTHGCVGCHTGSGQGGFVLGSRDELLAGDSDHGPVVTVRRGGESALVRKLRGTAGFGAQMPLGGDPLPDDEILVIQDWIDQGVRDN